MGGTATNARLPKATSATLYSLGTFARNCFAASFAASSRVGDTSCASIDREMSIASTTVASCRGTRIFACGRAIPTMRNVSASRNRIGGIRRSLPGRRSIRFGTSARLAKRAAPALRRRS